MSFDLHCHSTASDGTLAPAAVIARALANGVTTLALTDHDTVAGYRGLEVPGSITLVPGVEFSAAWRNRAVHVVGLDIDLDAETLGAALRQQHEARERRARRIAESLVRAGVEAPLEGARRQAGDGAVGRPHFARHMVASGFSSSVGDAFRRHLGDGRRGDVKQEWPDLAVVVDWIFASGGTPVLAHPARYRLTATRLRLLVDDFTEAGGTALEVVCGSQPPDLTRRLGALARERDLAASCGSDFHRPGQPWADLGRMPALPADCVPVWASW